MISDRRRAHNSVDDQRHKVVSVSWMLEEGGVLKREMFGAQL